MTSASTDRVSEALLTDLYQLTMLQGYFDRGMHDEAVFEFYVRRLPPERNFLVAAGLAQALEFLETLRFTASDIDALRDTGLFGDAFLESLAALRFTGDVDAVPEGTVFFANEPIVRVVAPLPQAQLVESRLINLVHLQTLIASKAARCVLAASGAPLVDFGMRRAHGAEAALLAARAAYVAGFAGTATVAAHPRFGVPIFGTMAHSFVQAHDSEAEAFAHFAASQRGAIVLLIDTYDTEAGARRAAQLAATPDGGRIDAVRIDSGDLDATSRRVRAILDAAGAERIRILASGGLDEHAVAKLVGNGAPIDGFGIGTSLTVSADVPALDCVYKLQEYAGKARRKRSEGKATWPGRKQVYRRVDAGGRLAGDTLTVVGDTQPGAPLLEPVMRSGAAVAARPGLDEIRARARAELDRLPEALRAVERHADYPVRLSGALEQLAADVDRELG